MYSRIDLRLRPSIGAALLAGIPWLLLAVALALLAFTLHSAIAVLAVPPLVTGYQRWCQCGLLHSERAIVRFYRDPTPASGQTPWTIELRNGERHAVEVLGDSRVTGALAVLALRDTHGNRFGPLVLHGVWPRGADVRIDANCDATDFRRARACLRLMPRQQ